MKCLNSSNTFDYGYLWSHISCLEVHRLYCDPEKSHFEFSTIFISTYLPKKFFAAARTRFIFVTRCARNKSISFFGPDGRFFTRSSSIKASPEKRMKEIQWGFIEFCFTAWKLRYRYFLEELRNFWGAMFCNKKVYVGELRYHYVCSAFPLSTLFCVVWLALIFISVILGGYIFFIKTIFCKSTEAQNRQNDTS